MSTYRFKGKTSRKTSENVLAKCYIGNREVKAVADSFLSTDGSEAHVVRIEGIGKPTIFGAMKFCAIVEMANTIGAHFKEIGQIE